MKEKKLSTTPMEPNLLSLISGCRVALRQSKLMDPVTTARSLMTLAAINILTALEYELSDLPTKKSSKMHKKLKKG